MNNPCYIRLIKKDDNGMHRFVGVKRMTTEFWKPGSNKWQLEPLDHDSDDSINLAVPPIGIASLRRPRLGKRSEL